MDDFRRGHIGGPKRQERSAIEQLSKKKVKLFKGTTAESSEVAENWLDDMSRVCDEIKCSDEEKLECLVSLLKSDVVRWWESICLTLGEELKTLDFFQEEFQKNYMDQVYLDQRRLDFMQFKQRDKSVLDNKIEFVNLSRYGLELVPNAREWSRKFKEGLRLEIREALLILCTKNFNELVDAALEAEDLQKKVSEKSDGSSSFGESNKKAKSGN